MKGLWDEPLEKPAAPAAQAASANLQPVPSGPSKILPTVRLGTRVCVLPGISVHHAKSEQGVDLSIIQLNEGVTESQREAYTRIIHYGSYGGLTIEQADDQVILTSPSFAGTLGHMPSLGWRLQKRIEVFEQIAAIVASLHAEKISVGSLDPNVILLDDQLLPVVLGPSLVNEFGPYTAPETIERGIVDVRADVYSLGRLLHFIVGQQVPPIEHTDPPRLEDMITYPAGLSRIVRKAVLRSPGARYSSVQALLNDLAKYGRYEEVGIPHKEVTEQNFGGMSLRPEPLPVAKKQTTKTPTKSAKAAAAARGRNIPAVEFTPKTRLGMISGGLAGFLVSVVGSYFMGSSIIWNILSSLGAGSFMFAIFTHGIDREFAVRSVFGLLATSMFFTYSPANMLASLGGQAELRKGDAASRAAAVKKLNTEGKTDFKKVDLSGADMQEADIMFGNFTDANLENANLSKAKLVMSNFTNTQFRGAKLQGATLTGSTTEGVIGFEGAECDAQSVLPSHWACIDGHPARSEGGEGEGGEPASVTLGGAVPAAAPDAGAEK